MKTTFVAAAGLLATATAQSLCAVTCFQSVVTEHPPLSCKEANMYLCFCKAKDLQSYFAECAYTKCGNNAEETINFGVNLCKDLGVPIDPPTRPVTSTTTQVPSVTAPSTTAVAPTGTSAHSSPVGSVKTTTTVTTSVQSQTSQTSKASSPATIVTQKPSHTNHNNGTQATTSGVVTAAAANLKLGPAMLVAVGVGAAAVQLL